MNEEKYILLVYKKLKGELSTDEAVDLESWLQKDEDHRKLEQQVASAWSESKTFQSSPAIDMEGDYAKLRSRIQAEQLSSGAKVRDISGRRNFLAWAAAIALLIVTGMWFMQSKESPQLVLQTKDGEQKEITLSDGSQIWLNENSRLVYPAQFEGIQRSIQLEGEAFFEVQSNPKRPFIIQTSSTAVTVLGTAFSCRDYSGENESVVLVKEGKVSMQALEDKEELILTANEKGILNKQNLKLGRARSSNLNEHSWKTGKITFKATPLKEALAELMDVFELEVQLENQEMETCPVSGRYSKATGESILKDIASVYQMKLTANSPESFTLLGGVCE